MNVLDGSLGRFRTPLDEQDNTKTIFRTNTSILKYMLLLTQS